MYEIWTYAVSAGPSKVYYAVWGGGVLEYDVRTEAWKDYNDPDGETEIVLFKDQGLIHEITTSVSYTEKDQMLWVATYFGASRYDGRNWHNYLQKDSGLPSNFLNQVKAIDGSRAWFSTDKGLAYFDGDTWAVYRPALDTQKPEMYVRDSSGKITTIETATAPAHNYVLGVDFQGDDIWVATAKGLSHGIRIHPEPAIPSRRAPRAKRPGSANTPSAPILADVRNRAAHVRKRDTPEPNASAGLAPEFRYPFACPTRQQTQGDSPHDH